MLVVEGRERDILIHVCSASFVSLSCPPKEGSAGSSFLPAKDSSFLLFGQSFSGTGHQLGDHQV